MNKAFCPRTGIRRASLLSTLRCVGVAGGRRAAGQVHPARIAQSKCKTPPGFAIFRAAKLRTSTNFKKSCRFEELTQPVYPKNFDAPLCACFGFQYDDVEADVRDGVPTRIRELLAKSKTPEAHCQSLAADGRCCMATVQELYMKLRGPG